jgi:uncharacterized membrane protein YgcG
MDQAREILKLLWRERFWVLSVMGILVAVGCWYISSGDLDQQFTEKKSQIELALGKVKTLANQPNPPNDDVNRADEAQLEVQKKIVGELWNDLYEKQREVVLQWPENLRADLIEKIEKLQFGEPFPSDWANDFRSHYQNYIKNRFDGLLEIPKALKLEDSVGGSSFGGMQDFGDEGGRGGGGRGGGGGGRGGGGRGGRGGGEMIALVEDQTKQDYLVQWIDQNQLRQKLEFDSPPSSMQIWVTQEDLWVYEILLSVIARTNQERGATRPDNTAVRVILSLQVGRNAAAASNDIGSLEFPSQDAAPVGGRDDLGEERGPLGDGGMDRGNLFGGEREDMDGADALSFRYLDAEGIPYEGKPQDSEFRRLPVRLRLLMDQRWIPQVLIECANAALPVEVIQLRVNPGKSGLGTDGKIGSDTIGGDTNLADVEIRGIVYIYNKPDESVLEVPGMETDQVATTTADSVQR